MIVVKTHKFESKTKSFQLDKYISEPDEIY
jgi:hypothetical protein